MDANQNSYYQNKKSINQNTNLPKELMFILDQKENYDIIENNLDKIKTHIKQRI